MIVINSLTGDIPTQAMAHEEANWILAGAYTLPGR